jgi:hypothetical protein
MTTPDLAVRTFLLGDPTGADDAARLTRALHDGGVLGTLGGATRALNSTAAAALGDELAGATGALLDLDLGAMLLAGWRRQRALADAARRSAEPPGSTEKVYLLAHEVSSVQHPAVDLVVDGVRVHRFRFEVEVGFDVRAATLVVTGGRLAGVEAGDVGVTATLRSQDLDRTLLSRSGRLRIGHTLPLRYGVPLLTDQHPPPAGERPPARPAPPGGRPAGTAA